MPNLNVNTTIKAPENIEIELVRLDALSTSSTYRVFFEIFLSVSSALLGVNLSVQSATMLHWFFWGPWQFHRLFSCTFLSRKLEKPGPVTNQGLVTEAAKDAAPLIPRVVTLFPYIIINSDNVSSLYR